MKTIYRILNDVDNYQFIALDNDEDVDIFSVMVRRQWKSTWIPPKVKIANPDAKLGDFYQFIGNVVITSPKATNTLLPFFTSAGELLPLPLYARELTVVNVLNIVDCLDNENSEWLYGSFTKRKTMLKQYRFISANLPKPGLFKIPETDVAETLIYVDSTNDSSENFKHVVESARLEGLLFERIWEE